MNVYWGLLRVAKTVVIQLGVTYAVVTLGTLSMEMDLPVMVCQ